MEVKISVIVPVYNTEKYLSKCINSLVNQTLKDIEIIFIDDGSTDNSKNIIQEYAKNDKRIKYFYKENGGQATARNLGLEKAIGEYILFIDSDDFIDKNMLNIMYNIAKSNNLDIVYSDYYIYYSEDNKKIEKSVKIKTNNDIINYILSAPSPCNKLFRRDFLIEQRFKFPEGIIYEDFASIPALGINDPKIEYIEKPLYYYVQSENSTMRNTEYKPKFENIFEAIENLKKLFTKSNKQEQYKPELEFLYIEHLLRGAAFRFLSFDKRENIKKIVSVMKQNYPKWYKNKYFKQLPILKKAYTVIIYNENYKVLSILKFLKKRKKI